MFQTKGVKSVDKLLRQNLHNSAYKLRPAQKNQKNLKYPRKPTMKLQNLLFTLVRNTKI